MRINYFRLLLICAFSTTPLTSFFPASAEAAPSAPAGPDGLTGSQIQRLESGDILVRVEPGTSSIKTVTSIGEVAASAADVYLLTTDFKNYARIYDSIASVQVEPQTAREVEATFQLRTPWPLPWRTVTTLTRLDPAHFAFRWRRTAGSMRLYDGRMQADPLDDHHCLVFYSARVDPGFGWLPGWFVTWGQGYVLPSIIRAIRQTLAVRTGPYWASGVQRPPFGAPLASAS